jgi:hypothetical protein
LVPPATAKREYDQRNARADVELVPDNIVRLILRNRNRLSKFDLYLLNGEDDVIEDSEPEEITRRSRRPVKYYESDSDEEDDYGEEEDDNIEIEREDEEDDASDSDSD